MNNVIVTITGPSGSGKSTLESKLCDPEGSIFHKVVSHTTRSPRKGEVDGVDYYFVTQKFFDEMSANREFAEVIKFGAHSYGAHEEELNSIFEQSKIAVVVVEPHGKEAIEEWAEHRDRTSCLTVFVNCPPSIRFERLINRFMSDIEMLELDSAPMRAQVGKFAERLAITSGIEAHWSEDDWQYNVQISSFGPDNSAAVVGQVTAEALNALTSNPNKGGLTQTHVSISA